MFKHKFREPHAIITGIDDYWAYDLYIPAEINGVPVTKIGDNAFASSKMLTNVTITNGITQIGFKAFYGCKSLEEIVIPDSVTKIWHYGVRLLFVSNQDQDSEERC